MNTEPYIDEQTGERLFNLHQAAQVIQTISVDTLRNWAKQGKTPFGFELDVRSEPVTHHRRSTQTPRTFLQHRLLLPAATVEALREILKTEPRRPGPISRDDMQALEAAARRFRLSLSHKENSPALG